MGHIFIKDRGTSNIWVMRFYEVKLNFLDLTFSFSIDDFLDLGGAFINI